MNKQLQPDMQQVTCDVCHRTMLKGEKAEPYLTPSRERRLVCALCAPRAQREGWIRESAAPETPTRPSRESDRRGLRMLRRRRRERAMPPSDPALTDPSPFDDGEAVEVAPQVPAEREPAPSGGRTRDPRNVRAVPTNAQLKLERAIEVFNESDQTRTVAGIARTLGGPGVSAQSSPNSAAEVILTVAWELAWYQYAVDLSDPSEPVQLRSRGEELEELPEDARQWNAQAMVDGTLALGAPEPTEADAGGEG